MVISRSIHVVANGVISFLWLSNIPLCVSVCVCVYFFVQLLSHVWLVATPWTAALQAFLSFTTSQNLLKLIEPALSSSYLVLCHLFLLLSSIFPSIKIFSNESALHFRWRKYWSFSISIDPSNEYSRLISFRIDWLDLLAIQGTLKSLLQHHSLKASVLWLSAFFMVQHPHLFMITGKTIAFTIYIEI